jgi:cysteine synthase
MGASTGDLVTAVGKFSDTIASGATWVLILPDRDQPRPL